MFAAEVGLDAVDAEVVVDVVVVVAVDEVVGVDLGFAADVVLGVEKASLVECKPVVKAAYTERILIENISICFSFMQTR
jgi:hypothetical protein